MAIDWQNFTPYLSLAGGLLIGGAAGWLVVFNGRIAGISGILGGLLQSAITRTREQVAWRFAFMLGLIIPSWVIYFTPYRPDIVVTTDNPTLIIAGLLVGLGTRYASGCTSGHGVCGLSRFSLRSLVATLTFMAAGFITVYFQRHFGG